MIIEVVSSNGDLATHQHHLHNPHNTHQLQQQQPVPPQQQMVLGESSGEDNHEIKAPKKRAETWVQDETRSLIGLRREMDGLFSTSKSNKHLWEQISSKMREKGFDRSPTMCTDKWRNLLKEFKKARHQERGSGSAKMSYYKEIDEILSERNNNVQYKSPTAASKADSYMQFAAKDFDDASIAFGPVEGMSLKFQFAASREKRKNANEGDGPSQPPPLTEPRVETAPAPPLRISTQGVKRPLATVPSKRPKKVRKNVLPDFEGENPSLLRQSLVAKYGAQLSLVDPNIQTDLTRSLYFSSDSDRARSMSNKEIGSMFFHKFYTMMPLALELLRRGKSFSSAERKLEEAENIRRRLEAELKQKEASELELSKKNDILSVKLQALTKSLEEEKLRREEELDKKTKLYADMAVEYGERLLKRCGELVPDFDFSQVEVDFPEEAEMFQESSNTGPSSTANPEPIITDLTVEDNVADSTVANPVDMTVDNLDP